MLDRTAQIESRLASVELFLAKLGFDAPAPPPPSEIQRANFLLASSEGLEEGQEQQEQQQEQQRVEEGPYRDQERAMLEDEEVQRLIERCMGQL